MYTFGRRPSLFLCLLLGVCLILILCDAANTSIYIKDSLAAFFPTASSSTKESSIVDDDDEDTPTPTSSKEEEKEDDQQQQQQRTNLLMIISDQFRYDAIRFVQDLMPEYDGKLKVRTPNLDRLARQGVYFSNAYAQTASCVPARAALRTGCTGHRTGVQGNVMIREEAYSVRNIFNHI
jgi:predicted AlkP superfamily pyrophosphatase or phosphodiesterase